MGVLRSHFPQKNDVIHCPNPLKDRPFVGSLSLSIKHENYTTATALQPIQAGTMQTTLTDVVQPVSGVTPVPQPVHVGTVQTDTARAVSATNPVNHCRLSAFLHHSWDQSAQSTLAAVAQPVWAAITAMPTQPSIPPGSVNEYQLRLGRQRQVWFIPIADERGVCR